MKEPIYPSSIWEHNYKDRTENIVIYSYYENIRPCNYCGEIDCHEECDDAIEDLGDDYEKNKSETIHTMTLQKILDLLPEGIHPSDVKMKLDIDIGAMSVDGSSISFYYEKHIPGNMEQYKKDKMEYDIKYAKYEEELKEYKKWQKQQEIKKLEDQLNALKD